VTDVSTLHHSPPMPALPASAAAAPNRKTIRAKSSWPAQRAGLRSGVEAAGIEPASAVAPAERLQA